MDVTYDLYDPDGDAMTIRLYLSPDGGVSYPIYCRTVQGDVTPEGNPGHNIPSGTGKQIVWDAGADYPSHQGTSYVLKVAADDGHGYDGMLFIPAGKVRMGQAGISDAPISDANTDPYVAAFYMDAREVSNGEYKAFMNAGGYATEAYWNPVGWQWRVAGSITAPVLWTDPTYHGGGVSGNDAFPVVGVSWFEADAYARWIGKRLPTEAEWEKAAKGGCEIRGLTDPNTCDTADTLSYPWGHTITGNRANYSGSGDPYESSGRTTPVGYYDGSNHGGYQTQNSPSPYGCYDNAGSAWEWCSTKYAAYPYNASDGRENSPAISGECCRVLRGGSFSSSSGDSTLRCAYRYPVGPFNRYYYCGFRCTRT